MKTVPDDLAPESAGPKSIELRRLRAADPLRWLAMGGRDFIRAPRIALFYGSCFVGMGWLLAALYRGAPAYVMALCASFLLVAPFLCLGLYQTSRRLDEGQEPTLAEAIVAWDARTGQLAIFGLLLLVLELLWARATLVAVAVSFDAVPSLKSSIAALSDPDNLAFIVAWLAVGAVFAGLIFAISAVAMPLILDRDTDAVTAALTSARLVVSQPLVMGAWAVLIVVLVGAAMLPFFLGLLVVGPVIGHATWHAYRHAVI